MRSVHTRRVILGIIACLCCVGSLASASPQPLPTAYYFNVICNDLPSEGEENPGLYLDSSEADGIGFFIEYEETMGGTITLDVTNSGNGRIAVKYAHPTTGAETLLSLPAEWDLDAGDTVPERLYIVGTTASLVHRDTELEASWEESYGGCSIPWTLSDEVKATVDLSKTATVETGTGIEDLLLNESQNVTTPDLDGTVKLQVGENLPQGETINSVEYKIYSGEEDDVVLVDTVTVMMPVQVQTEAGVADSWDTTWTPSEPGAYQVRVTVRTEDVQQTVFTHLDTAKMIILDAGVEGIESPGDLPGLSLWLDASEDESRDPNWNYMIRPLISGTDTEKRVYKWFNSADGAATRWIQQGRSNRRPTWKKNGGAEINGKPYIEFDSTKDQFLSFPVHRVERTSNNSMLFMIVKLDGTYANDDTLFSTYAGTRDSDRYMYLRSDGTNLEARLPGASTVDVMSDSSWCILTVAVTGDKVKFFKNGVAVGSEYTLDEGTDWKKFMHYRLGNYRIQAHKHAMSGKVAEVLLYRSLPLTDTDLASPLSDEALTPALERREQVWVERHLSDKYGIDLSDGTNGANSWFPTVRVEYPCTGKSFRASEGITFKAQAFDPDDLATPIAATNVDFYVLEPGASSPTLLTGVAWNSTLGVYECTWTPTTAGEHSFWIEAEDDGTPSHTSTSEPTYFDVHGLNNGIPIPTFTSPGLEPVTPDVDGYTYIEVAAIASALHTISSVELTLYREGTPHDSSVTLNQIESGQDLYGKKYPLTNGTWLAKVRVTEDDDDSIEITRWITVNEVAHPGNYGDQLDLWLKPEQDFLSTARSDGIQSKPTDGSRIYRWINAAGQSAVPWIKHNQPSKRPTWIESVSELGGKPVIRFAGGQALYYQWPAEWSNSTTFMVMKQNRTNNHGVFFSHRGSHGRALRLWNRAGAGVRTKIGASWHDIMGTPSDEYVILTVQVSGEALHVYRNGQPLVGGEVDWADGGADTVDARNLRLWKRYLLGLGNFDIAEMLVFRTPTPFTATEIVTPVDSKVYDQVLSDVDRLAIERYLSRKFSIALEQANQPPSVSVVNPQDFSTLTAGAVTVAVSATDSEGDTKFTPLDSLESRWGFDPSSGTEPTASTGNGHDLSVPSSTGWVTGNYGGAYVIGSTESIALPAASLTNVQGTAARTITAWYYADSGNDDKPLLAYGSEVGGSLSYFKVFAGAGKVRVKVGQGSTEHEMYASVTASDWNHIAVTLPNNGDSEDCQIYLNGGTPLALTPVGTSVTVNTGTGSGVLGGGSFAGRIDDVRIYSEVFDQAGVEAVMNLASGQLGPQIYVNGQLIGRGAYDGEGGLYKYTHTFAQGRYAITAVASDNGIPVQTTTSSTTRIFVVGNATTADDDGDGIHDWWEMTHFGNVDVADGSIDSDQDGDGVSDLAEFQNGTNPEVDNSARDAATIDAVLPTVGSSAPLPIGGNDLVFSATVNKVNAGDAIVLKDRLGNVLTDAVGYKEFASGLEYQLGFHRRCVQFDGIDSYIALTNDKTYASSGAFSLVAWIKVPSNASGESPIIGHRTSGEAFTIKDGALNFIDSTGAARVVANRPVPADLWVHVAVTRATNGELTLYQDGEEAGSSGTAWTGALDINAIGADDGDFFAGWIDDVRFYNSELDAAAIGSVKNDTSGPTAANHWKLDETSGTADDGGGSSNDGTLTGNAAYAKIASEDFPSGGVYEFVLEVGQDSFDLWFTVDQSLPTVTVTEPGGRYYDDVMVPMTASELATIYYTLDGTLPTTESTQYTAPLALLRSEGAKVLQYCVVDTAGNEGPIGKQVYFFAEPLPPVSGLQETDPDKEDVHLAWSQWTAGSLDKYVIYRATSQAHRELLLASYHGGHNPPASLEIGTTANVYYDDTSVTLGDKAWYTVTAKDASGNETAIWVDTNAEEVSLLQVDLDVATAAASLDAAIDRARHWLAVNQQPTGCWGDGKLADRIRGTAQVLKALQAAGDATDKTWYDAHASTRQRAAMYLRGVTPDNTPDLAGMIDALQRAGQNTAGLHMRLALRAALAGTDEIFGWGVNEYMQPDALSTALGCKARDGITSSLPLDGGAGPVWSLQLHGMNANDASAWLRSLETYRFGWASRGLESVYVSSLVYSAIGWNDSDDGSFHGWILSQQDGENHSFGNSMLDTYAVLLWLPIDMSDEGEDAAEWLRGQQRSDGSWNGNAFLTGLCLEALQKANE